MSFGQVVYVFEESPKSIRDVIGDVYCPGRYCFIREKCEYLDSYVTTPRSILGCGRCGTWLFVHKVLIMLQDHVRTTKRDKTRFLCHKRMILVPNKQLLPNVQIQSTKYGEKNLCLDNEVPEIIGDVYC